MFSDDPLVICPYDKSHQVRKSRMQVHLVRCQNTHKSKAPVRCPFNATHVMTNPDQLKDHVANCPNRRVMDSFLYRDQNAPSLPRGIPPVGSDNFNPEFSNEWDTPVTGSVLDSVRSEAKEKDVYLSIAGGASKSVRKAHANEQRKRLAQIKPKESTSKAGASTSRL